MLVPKNSNTETKMISNKSSNKNNHVTIKKKRF